VERRQFHRSVRGKTTLWLARLKCANRTDMLTYLLLKFWLFNTYYLNYNLISSHFKKKNLGNCWGSPISCYMAEPANFTPNITKKHNNDKKDLMCLLNICKMIFWSGLWFNIISISLGSVPTSSSHSYYIKYISILLSLKIFFIFRQSYRESVFRYS
jgi:hypothetical protein